MEELKCVHCNKKAKFEDSERDPYCSEECFKMVYKVNSWKVKAVAMYECMNCNSFIQSCDECKKEFDGQEVMCDADQGVHFCSNKCYLKHWDFHEIEEGDDP